MRVMVKRPAGQAWYSAIVRRADNMAMVTRGFGPGEKFNLTAHERDIVLLLAHGLKDREIAGKLSISTDAVQDHLRKIFTKLGVTDRLELACYAVQHQL